MPQGGIEPFEPPRIAALRELGPALFLILCVLGSMYGGLATPTEAAALGVIGAAMVSGFQGSLTLATVRDVAIGSDSPAA